LEAGEEGFFIRFLAVIAPSGNAGNIALDADVLEGDAAVLGIPDQVRLDARWRYCDTFIARPECLTGKAYADSQ